MDTKWKLLYSDSIIYGISQTDMYQMYAYSKKYGASKVFVIYPYNEWVSQEISHGISYSSDDEVRMEIVFVDPENTYQSIQYLLSRLEYPESKINYNCLSISKELINQYILLPLYKSNLTWEYSPK